MTAEQQFFIQLLSDHIHCRPSYPENNDLDWNKILYYAEDQALPGMIYIQTRDFFREHPGAAPDAAEKLHKGFYSDIYLYANRKAELKEIAGRCREVPMALMKGSVVQESYPVPALRSMGDIDIIIYTEDREKTDAVMQAEGYSRMIDNHAVWTYDKEHIEFEIHDHMFYEYLANDIDYRSYFDQVWEHVHLLNGTENIYIPDRNFHFLFLITHLAKHITNKGMGFRAFLDLVFMTQNKGERMDWQWIQSELQKLKLLQFTKTCFAFCQRWFDVNMPIETTGLDERFYKEVSAKMFSDGIFGLENEENIAAHSAKEIKRSKDPYWISALKLTFHRLFPPYRDMQLVPWYQFVDGRPWLLPAAWVYRWFYTAAHKFRQSRDLLTEPYKKRKAIEKRENMIRDWGL